MKFAWKVTLVTLCILVTAFSVGSYFLVSLSFQSALNREIESAQEEMQLLRVSYEALCAAKGVTLENIDTVGRRVSRTLEENANFQNHQFRVSTVSGRSLYSTLAVGSDKELLAAIDLHSSGYILRRNEATGAVRIHWAGTIALVDGVVRLETVRDISSLFVDRETHYQVYRWLLLAVVAISGGILFLMSTWLTKPIRGLALAASALASGDYGSRAVAYGNDEISDLASNFNHMADAIEKNVQALEDAKQRQEEFTASFVHELKTPLTSIIGYADMLRSRQLEEDKRFKAASYIFSEGKRLETLSLSLMSLLVVGHNKEDCKNLSMSVLAENAAKVVRPAFAKKDLTLHVRVEPGEIAGDGALLQTLLVNLLDNARKASHPGGIVSIEGRAAKQGYCFAVTDQGRGMPEKELGRITEAFYMVDKSRARAEGGSGLGLALCEKIAALHNGSIQFISKEGAGTRVIVALRGVERHDECQ